MQFLIQLNLNTHMQNLIFDYKKVYQSRPQQSSIFQIVKFQKQYFHQKFHKSNQFKAFFERAIIYKNMQYLCQVNYYLKRTNNNLSQPCLLIYLKAYPINKQSIMQIIHIIYLFLNPLFIVINILNIFQNRQMSRSSIRQANVHPLVLLSIVDHFNRVNPTKSNVKRVVGALLGSASGDVIQISNSYAIPFEEDISQNNIWFLDHLYHQSMFDMMKKISQKEKFIGWYTTGSSFKSHDIQINQVFEKYTSHPVFLVVDVQHDNELALPTQAFVTQQQVDPKSGSIEKQFFHIQSRVEAFEPEQIGVEHLLREIKQISLNSLSSNIQLKVQTLQGLSGKIREIVQYLKDVIQEKLPPNNKIIFILQEIINLLPNLNSQDLIKAYSAKNNDLMFAIYVCAMTRGVLALHTLIFVGKDNQAKEKQREEQKEKEKKKEEEKKQKQAKKK